MSSNDDKADKVLDLTLWGEKLNRDYAVQGEERAALNRASFDSAPELKLGPSDLIMFSAKVINAEYTAAYCTITPS